jgi:Kef-type K+ transport system membrane component KefB
MIPERSFTIKAAAIYTAMLLAASGIVFTIHRYGASIAVGPGDSTATTNPVAPAAPDILWHLLLALAAVVIVGRILGAAFKFIGQPPVIGEVVAGIALGPSLLGLLSPDAYHYLLPATVAPFLGVVAQLGVILYMFLVGLELNPELLRGKVHSTVAISHASIVLPFVLGSALALYLYPAFAPGATPFTSFALFLGLAMSITAFPVLARILTDFGISRTELGTVALTCAAVDDVTAWCLLALVVGAAHASAGSAVLVAALTVAFILVMFVIVRPIVSRVANHSGDRNRVQGSIAVVVVILLVSALTTEAIGIHAIFGAFLFGAVIPHDSKLASELKRSMESLVTILFLPAFFAFTGMRTEIGLVSGLNQWLICGLIIAVATAGKFGGTFAAARVTGMAWRQAAGLGVLMNTRGLMELIVLNVGLELGVITPTLFTMMVLMALVTTIATTPILHRLIPR